MGFFDKLKQGLSKTRGSIAEKVNEVFASAQQIDDDFFDELEEALITADMGAYTAAYIIEELRDRVEAKRLRTADRVKEELRDVIRYILTRGDCSMHLETKPSVVLVIGVNGVGKTTNIGKLAHFYKSQGKRVMLAAADTFRAAAIDQLDVWAQRSGCEIIKHQENSDPAAVIFDACSAAKARRCDILICDTAGRLHNKKNLMEELAKISRVIERELGEASKEVLLVLDATTGQNALSQAKVFSEVADITGIILSKLDGTAKGGVVLAIHRDLGLPVKFIGVGEQVDDLQPFDAEDFARALFERRPEA